MNLSLKDFYKLPKYKDTNLRTKNDILYKMCRFPEDLSILPYLKSMPKIDGAITPQNLLRERFSIYGYTMPEIPHSITCEEYLNSPIEIDIIKSMKSIFEILKELHKYIVVGDVRNANILLADNKVYFCDLESGDRVDEASTENLWTYYNLTYRNYSYINHVADSIIADEIKAFICALCLYYGIDFENICKNANYYNKPNINLIYEILNASNANPLFIEYLNIIINDIETQESTSSIDIIELLDFINPPSTKETERLKRCLKL